MIGEIRAVAHFFWHKVLLTRQFSPNSKHGQSTNVYVDRGRHCKANRVSAHNWNQKVLVLDRVFQGWYRCRGNAASGQSFNRDFFVDNVLSKIIDNRALGRPKLKARGIFLYLDSARPHLCNDEFEELEIRRLLHPPYSLDLASCNFWIFGHLKQCVKGQSFDNPMAFQAEVSEILISIEVGTFVRVFTEWKWLLRQCVEQGGNYL
jgi:hypothetical protein